MTVVVRPDVTVPTAQLAAGRHEGPVVGFQAKDGSPRASSRELRLPDGRRMDLGGSGSTTIDQKK